MRRRLVALAVLFVGLATAALFSYDIAYWIGIQLLYTHVDLPEAQVRRDLHYVEDAPEEDRRRLDFYLPTGDSWPIVIFIHGGGWTEGDKGLRVGGADIYGNIGRFFATHGIGAAVINYRLLPIVGWRDQIEDVARATAWVRTHAADLGGNPSALFLMGHSAGAQLAARVALDPVPLLDQGLPADAIRGVIAVSGAGYDLVDEQTYELGADRAYYAERFGVGPAAAHWQQEASPVRFVDGTDPPFLVLFGGSESQALQHQARLFDAALRAVGVPSRLVGVPDQRHERIVLTLSRDDRTAGPVILQFISSAARTARP